MLTTLSVVLKTAVDWGVIARVPCSIRLLRTPKSAASFHDFDEYERLVAAARIDTPNVPKGGWLRYVPLTRRLAEALRNARHLRGARVLCDAQGQPLTQKVVQLMLRRAARRANVKPGVHILRHAFCSHLAMRGAPARAIQELAGRVAVEK